MKKHRFILWSIAGAAAIAVGAQPQLILDEDFTSGDFAEDTQQQWQIDQGEGVGFLAPNNRDFPYALSRRLAEGSRDWAGAKYALWNDANGNGQFNDGELRQWRMSKANDVCVLKFRAFSDVVSGSSPWIYGVEVAMMEWRDAFCDDFHYCHDLQWEARQVFLNNNTTWHALQLISNVENVGENKNDYPDGDYPFGVRFAHFETNNGRFQQSDLDSVFDNTVIWRPLPERNATNFEIWGERNSDDYTIDTAMNSTHDPDNPDAIFDHVQITFFRPYDESRTSIIREGVLPGEAQIGICNLSLGITRKSDFNTDYVIDEQDAAVLEENWGRIDSASLLTGDANNDNRVDIHDANPLIGFWSIPVSDTFSARGFYNDKTGEIRLGLTDVSYFKLTCDNGCFSADEPDFSGFSPHKTVDTDSIVGAYTTDAWTVTDMSLGEIAQAGLDATALSLTINSKGSGKAEGYTVRFDNSGAVFAAKPHRKPANRRFAFEGLHTLAPAGRITLALYDLQGKLLAREQTDVQRLSEKLASISEASNLRTALVRVFDANGFDQIIKIKIGVGSGLICFKSSQ